MRLVQGDTKTLTITLKTTANAAFDLTGMTGAILVKRSYEDADAAALITGALTIASPSTGVGVFAITSAMTTYMIGLYVVDIRITITATSAVSTVYRDSLWVEDK